MSTVIGILYIETVANDNDGTLLDELSALVGVEMALSLTFGPYDVVALVQAIDEKGLVALRNAVSGDARIQSVQLAVADDVRPPLPILAALGLIGEPEGHECHCGDKPCG